MGQTANTLGFKGHLVSVSTPGTGKKKRKKNLAIVAGRQKAAIDEMEIDMAMFQ